MPTSTTTASSGPPKRLLQRLRGSGCRRPGRHRQVPPRRRPRAGRPAARGLVVDDGSPDGTADLATVMGEELGGIEVVRRKKKAGLGGAYRAGFAWGLEHEFDVMVEMDADLSHDPADLPQ